MFSNIKDSLVELAEKLEMLEKVLAKAEEGKPTEEVIEMLDELEKEVNGEADQGSNTSSDGDVTSAPAEAASDLSNTALDQFKDTTPAETPSSKIGDMAPDSAPPSTSGSFLDLAKGRRSIRKYADATVPDEDLEYFIQAAIQAPSGHNSQCWHFVAVKDKSIIEEMAKAVADTWEDVLKSAPEGVTPEFIAGRRKGSTFFTKAPLVIAVYMTPSGPYDVEAAAGLTAMGMNEDDIMKRFGSFDLLSIGAAVQNLLLAIHEKGYGACWMNHPTLAGERINEVLGVPADQRLISIIPVGIPDYAPREKRMKPLDEVFTIL